MIRGNDPSLLTPGPLTTSLETKQAMLRDCGSWDAAFNEITASICKDVVDVVNGAGSHVCVPLQGSGTFSVEAALANIVPREGGAGAQQRRLRTRILKICAISTATLVHRHRRGQAGDHERTMVEGPQDGPHHYPRGAGALRNRHRHLINSPRSPPCARHKELSWREALHASDRESIRSSDHRR